MGEPIVNIKRLIPLLALTVAAACGGPPQPGEPGYPYNVEGAYTGTISVDGQAFDVAAQFVTDPGGKVSGTFESVAPVTITGVLEGTLLGDELDLTLSYRNNPMTGCSGTVSGTLTVVEGGAALAGPMTVSDCGDTLGADVRLNRTR